MLHVVVFFPSARGSPNTKPADHEARSVNAMSVQEFYDAVHATLSDLKTTMKELPFVPRGLIRSNWLRTCKRFQLQDDVVALECEFSDHAAALTKQLVRLARNDQEVNEALRLAHCCDSGTSSRVCS